MTSWTNWKQSTRKNIFVAAQWLWKHSAALFRQYQGLAFQKINKQWNMGGVSKITFVYIILLLITIDQKKSRSLFHINFIVDPMFIFAWYFTSRSYLISCSCLTGVSRAKFSLNCKVWTYYRLIWSFTLNSERKHLQATIVSHVQHYNGYALIVVD